MTGAVAGKEIGRMLDCVAMADAWLFVGVEGSSLWIVLSGC